MRLALSIRAHLGIGFGLIIGLILILLGVGSHLIRRMEETERKLDHEIAERSNEAVEIERAFLNQSIALHSYLATQDPKYLKEYQREDAARKAAIAQLKRIPMVSPGTEIFNRIQQSTSELETLAGQAFTLLKRNGSRQELDALETRLRQVRSEVIATTREFTDLQNDRRHEEIAAMEGLRERLIRLLVSFSTVVLVICTAAALITIRAVRGPIQRMIAAITAMERGDYAPAMKLARLYPRGAARSRNEMDIAAGTFGRMADAIRRRETRLAADREIAAGLAASLDPMALAADVLDKIIAYTGLEGGAVYLAADGHPARLLTSRGMEGLPEFVNPESEPEGRALREGHAAVNYRLRDDHPCRVQGRQGLIRPRTLAAEPLICQERVVGVILVGGLGELGGDGADFLRHAADHLGISLQNALTHQEVRRLAEALQDVLSELRGQAEALAEADRRKNEFLAMMAHELRNPLAAISNANSILELGATNGDQARRQRAIVTRQIRHLARMVDDLLDVSRITRGKVALRRERVALEEAVRHTVEACRARLEEQQLQLEVCLPEEPVTLHADPTRLEQMIGNLVQNAIKYTAAGGRIWIQGEMDGCWACLRVRDTGIGIAPEVLPRVFDLFTQAESGPDRAKGGLGIGLTMVKSLAEMHGGSVEARSAGLNQGSEFLLRLPLAREMEGAGTQEERAEAV